MAQGEYELGARVGLGIKMAHEAALKLATDYTSYLELIGNLTDGVVQHVIDTQAKHLVTDTFPGATTVPSDPQPAPQPARPVQQQSGPPSVPNQSTGGDWKAQKAEESFRLFVQDTTAWEDVRDKKTSDNSPDFRHRFMKDPPNKDGKEYKKSLWLRDAPEWAKPQLQSWGLL